MPGVKLLSASFARVFAKPSYSVSMRARVVASSVGERKSTEMASRKWSAGLKSWGTGAPSAAKCAEHFAPPSPAYIKRPPESSTS